MRGEYVIDVQNIRPPIFAAYTAFGVGEIRPNRSRLQPNQPRCVEKYHEYVHWSEAGNERRKLVYAKNEYMNSVSSPEGR